MLPRPCTALPTRAMVATRSRSATDDAPSFADLTDDTLVCVFQMLRPDELGACLRTCKTWRRLICEGNMDEHWWDIGAECGMSRDEKMKFPRSDGRRVCDVVASRWIRRRDSRKFLSACHADVLASTGGHGVDPVTRKVPLRLREWVKTRTVVDTKSELARHDHADLADYYRDIMAEVGADPGARSSARQRELGHAMAGGPRRDAGRASRVRDDKRGAG